MMRRRFEYVFLLAALLGSVTASAEQRVVLESGTVLTGDVAFNGGEVVVKIGGAELQLPLSQVNEIAPAGDAPVAPAEVTDAIRAERMVANWLEARALSSNGGGLFNGLLAEAYRLDPGNPRVAYWYADSLLLNGMGVGARTVVESHREAIAEAYPVVLPQLEKRIAERCQLEEAPSDFVAAVDRLNKEMGSQSQLQGDSYLIASAFRLLDQEGEPIGKSSFRVDGNGNNESVEAFGQGYYVCTYTIRRNSGTRRCVLSCTDAELEQGKELDVDGSVLSVKMLGDLTVRRRDPSDLVKTAIKVLDAEGEALREATVTIYASSRSSSSASRKVVISDAEGLAESELYPGRYRLTVHAPGYTPVNSSLNVTGGKTREHKIQVQLDKVLQGEVRIAWRVLDAQRGAKGEVQESRFPMTQAGFMGHSHGMEWLRVTQLRKKLLAHIGNGHYGPMAGLGNSWIRKSDKLGFGELDFDEFEKLKFELKERPKPPSNPIPHNGAMTFEMEPGVAYFGTTLSMNRIYRGGNNEPGLVQYKLMFFTNAQQEE